MNTPLQTKRLFVTGGTGFIGSHFVQQAIAGGHSVTALRRSPASRPRIPLSTEPSWLDKQMNEVSPEDLAGTDVLIHLAAHTPNAPYDTLENCLLWNVLKPLELFRTAINAGVDHFVVAGSCFEYGLAGERYERIPANAPLEPTLSYPASKAAASLAFSALAIETNVRISIHRIFQVFGEGESPNRLWPSLRAAAIAGQDMPMTAGEQVRDFINVTDVAQELLAACELRDVKPGQPYLTNLGSGKPQTVRDFAEHWWDQWGAKGQLKFGAKQYRPGEVMRYVPFIEVERHLS